MALLRVDSKGKPHTIKTQLDGNTAADLRLYARFAGDTTTDAVIKAALIHAFEQDTEFLEWKKKPENLQEPQRPQRKKVESKATTTGTPPHQDNTKLAAK